MAMALCLCTLLISAGKSILAIAIMNKLLQELEQQNLMNWDRQIAKEVAINLQNQLSGLQNK